jgi:hypothetical protein
MFPSTEGFAEESLDLSFVVHAGVIVWWPRERAGDEYRFLHIRRFRRDENSDCWRRVKGRLGRQRETLNLVNVPVLIIEVIEEDTLRLVCNCRYGLMPQLRTVWLIGVEPSSRRTVNCTRAFQILYASP